jgi:hypothetical protein
MSTSGHHAGTGRLLMNERCTPGLDHFWEQADRAGSGQHPLERELDERIDALARYRRLVSEAQANGREDAAEILLRQYDREEQAVERLREALRRT